MEWEQALNEARRMNNTLKAFQKIEEVLTELCSLKNLSKEIEDRKSRLTKESEELSSYASTMEKEKIELEQKKKELLEAYTLVKADSSNKLEYERKQLDLKLRQIKEKHDADLDILESEKAQYVGEIRRLKEEQTKEENHLSEIKNQIKSLKESLPV